MYNTACAIKSPFYFEAIALGFVVALNKQQSLPCDVLFSRHGHRYYGNSYGSRSYTEHGDGFDESINIADVECGCGYGKPSVGSRRLGHRGGREHAP